MRIFHFRDGEGVGGGDRLSCLNLKFHVVPEKFSLEKGGGVNWPSQKMLYQLMSGAVRQ